MNALHKILVFALAGACACAGRSTPPLGGKPNVLFIVCDDLNTHVGPSGYAPIRTPNLDRFAAESMTFRRAYCQYPVCGPSRASFLSGLYPQTTRVLSNKRFLPKTRPGTVTLPVAFRRAGYWTGAVGKVFHKPGDNPGGTAWDEVLKFANDELPMIAPARAAFEAKNGPVTDRRNKKAWRAFLETFSTQTRGQNHPGYGPTGLTDAQHKDGKNARQVAAWLKTRAHGDKPFFIACGIQKPHVPFLAPKAYFDSYPPESIRYSKNPADDWDDIPPIAASSRYKAFGFELGKENDSLRREYVQAYHACITFLDAQIGRVLDTLKESGHAKDTIVVFTSDHGYHLGEHFMWGKVTLFEECARVPLVVRVPGATRAGSHSEGLVELVDLFPTLAELCGVKAPGNLQGRSLVPMLADPAAPGKTQAYTVVTRGQKLGRSVRFGKWRYAEWGAPDQNELYDLTNDPLERTNLSGKPKSAPIVKKARRLLAQMAKAVAPK